jgi:hypothetical protein
MKNIMKKYLLYTLFGAASLMASCTEDFNEDVAAPQQWEQEEAITLPKLVLNGAGTIDLDLGEAGDSVTIFNPSLSEALPEGATLTNFNIAIRGWGLSDDYEKTIKASDQGKVATAELQAMAESNFGKRPKEYRYDMQVSANLIINGQASLLTGHDASVLITVAAPHIASSYYLVGDMCGWSAETMIQFSHSDKDVYEDPYFTVMFTTTADNQYWKIIPQEHVDEGNIWGNNVVGTAVDGDANLEGTLVNEGAQAGKIEKAGMYKMTINMMDYTYKISALAPEYFILGDTPFGWNVNDKKFMMYPETATVHSFTTKFEGNIKMINSNDMGTDNWGACYGTPVDGDTSASAGLKQDGGAIHVPESGYYTLTVDFKDMAYTWTKCENQEPTEYTNISLIGDFNGWGGDADLTQIAPHNWFIGNFEVGSTGGLKFRASHDWSTNWGATLNVADVNYGVGVGNGDNISVPAGTYNVFFNDITGNFVFQAI